RENGFGFQRRAYVGKDLALDLFFFGCGLDHQIALRERVVLFRRLDERQRALPSVLGDRFFADLTGHITVDRRHSGLNAISRYVVQQTLIPGPPAAMGDTVAHLAGADHSDSLNFDRHVLVRSMRSPGSLLRFRLEFVTSR